MPSKPSQSAISILGFHPSSDKVREVLRCVDCGKRRLVYSQYKPGGQGLLKLRKKLDSFASLNEFKCGDDISALFKDDVELKTKHIKVDGRLDCSDPISVQLYDSDNPLNTSRELICAFCVAPLKPSGAKTLQNLIKDPNMRVVPSCESRACLTLNTPKETIIHNE